MVEFNYQKRAYKAKAVQWLGLNTQEILEILGDAAPYGDDAIMVRWQDPISYKCGITTMYYGWWVVIGEDSRTRIYNPERFKILYEEI